MRVKQLEKKLYGNMQTNFDPKITKKIFLVELK